MVTGYLALQLNDSRVGLHLDTPMSLLRAPRLRAPRTHPRPTLPETTTMTTMTPMIILTNPPYLTYPPRTSLAMHVYPPPAGGSLGRRPPLRSIYRPVRTSFGSIKLENWPVASSPSHLSLLGTATPLATRSLRAIPTRNSSPNACRLASGEATVRKAYMASP
jgi:hypothetical protein